AVPDVDYRAVNTTLTFAAGARSVNCVVPILNDTLVDGVRTVNLALGVSPGGSALLGVQPAAVLTLNDNDQGGMIRFGAASYTVAEGGTASLTVLRSGANLASAVTVDYAVTGGSALGGGTDYTLVAGTLSFAAGLASRTIAVPTVNDSRLEGPETVVITLSNPTGGAALGAPAMTTLTIADNDTAGTVQFGAAAYSVPENVAGGVYNLLVTRTGSNLASGIVVSYTVTGGTATNGGDYTLADGALTFGAGQTSLPIPVLIHNDADVETNKTVVVTLSSATATLGAHRITTLTILDDEQVVTFGAAAYAVTEGVASMAIPILRAGPTPAGTTVTCRSVAGGSAVPDVDYRAVNTTLTFAAGARSVNCVVPILNDTLVDGVRTVNLALGVSPGGSALLGVQPASVLTLNDNDQGGMIRFGAASYTVAEGGTASLTVLRSGANLASAVTVDYAVTGGSALGGGTDYTLVAGTLSFAAGLASRTIAVPTVNDSRLEGPETVVITLSNPTGGAALGAPAMTTLTIADNDTAGTVQFGAAAYSVPENVAGGVYNLLVTRTGSNLASGIVVSYTVTGGTATNGGDYTLADGALTFGAGQTSLPIPVLIHNDADVETNKTVVVTLSSATATLGAHRITTLTILDDEQVVTFGAAAYAVTEGVASMAIPILRAGPTPAGTTVTCRSVAGGSAVPDVDYRAVNTTLTFAAGARSVNCVVPILNDTLVDGVRTVNLALGVSPGGSALLGVQPAAVLTLNDNDQGGMIRFGAASYTVAEGGTASLTVLRSGANLASAVTVDYAVTGGSALGGGTDYTLVAGTLSFAAGLASRTIAVPTVNDSRLEGPETVVITLSNPTGGAALGAPAMTTLTIADNDTAGTVQFGAAAYSVPENVAGGVYNLLVTRTGSNLASGIVVSYTVTGGTATNGGDYTLADGALTFGAGQTSLPIPVLIHNDADVEANKTVVVTLSSLTATLGAHRITTLTILDDEQVVTFGAAAYAVTAGVASMAIP